PSPPLFPYTTLFRSRPSFPRSELIILLPWGRFPTCHSLRIRQVGNLPHDKIITSPRGTHVRPLCVASHQGPVIANLSSFERISRSEEHTSELQSREN